MFGVLLLLGQKVLRKEKKAHLQNLKGQNKVRLRNIPSVIVTLDIVTVRHGVQMLVTLNPHNPKICVEGNMFLFTRSQPRRG